MNETQHLGKRIKELRIRQNLTQDELAKRLGYSSRSTINKLELGINEIHQTKLMAFASALNTTVPYLMGWTTNPDKDYLVLYEDGLQTTNLFLNKEQLKKIKNFIKSIEG